MAQNNIRFVEPFAFSDGQPFRIMPMGEFQRGERKIAIVKTDLEQMAANYATGKPRWKIPIYAGHPTDKQPDPPSVGYVQKLEVRDDGLYAYPEYNDDGKVMIDKGQYRYNSPGVLWSKNGSTYADEQGKQHDNIVDHIALTNRPFFGQNTALFSADPAIVEKFQLAGMDRVKHIANTMAGYIRSLSAVLTQLNNEQADELTGKDTDEDAGGAAPPPNEDGGDIPPTQQELEKQAKRPKVEATPGKPVDATNDGTYSATTAIVPDTFMDMKAATKHLQQAISLHQAHMDGKEPTDAASQ